MESLVEKPEAVVKLYDKEAGSWKFVRKNKRPDELLKPIERMLQKLGLSRNEVKVYIHLARTGEQKASEISEAVSIHRTETYRILRGLEKRGLVLSVFEKPLKFIATPFEKAMDVLVGAEKLKLERLERRTRKLVDIWLSLPKLERDPKRKEVFQILEGKEPINMKANELLDKTEKEIYVHASENDLAWLYHSGFMEKLEEYSEKKLDVRLLTNRSRKSCFFLEKMNLNNLEHCFSDLEGIPSFIVSGREQILLWVKNGGENREVAALWTNYEAFHKTLQTFFLELWNSKTC
jgi:sugar-specific transcriptional regulator TrmB